jgi:hypothetical protein
MLPKYIDWDGKPDLGLHQHLSIFKTPQELKFEQTKLEKQKARRDIFGDEEKEKY